MNFLDQARNRWWIVIPSFGALVAMWAFTLYSLVTVIWGYGTMVYDVASNILLGGLAVFLLSLPYGVYRDLSEFGDTCGDTE